MNTLRPIIVSMMAAMSASAAHAATDEGMEEVNKLRTPVSSVSVGAGWSSDDLHELARYNGRDESGIYGLLDFDINKRDEETGTWTRVDGQSVGFSNRSLRYERNRQGSWNYFIEFDQLDSVNPYLYDTDLIGSGTNAQVTGGPVHREQYSQQRKNVEVGMSRYLDKWSKVSLRYKHEDKEGKRAWGANGETKFMVEPIDYQTQEFEALLDYNLDKLQLRAGYLLSLFDNPTESVSLSAEPDDTATPPDNKSHNLFLSGGYDFSDRTRATFKVSRTRDLQDEEFFAVNTSTPSRTSLDGKIDTTRVNFGLVSRLSSQLTVKAKYRYEDRDDKTPQTIFYSSELNQLTSRTTVNGTLEGTYRMQDGVSVTAGVDQENWKRIVTDNPNMAKRRKTDETTVRLSARKSLSETVNGSVRISHAKRDGSDWIPGAADPDIFVNPIQWSDRDRNALRGMLDWYPSDQLSMQFVLQATRDTYDGVGLLGPQDGTSWLASVDSGYALSDEWSLNGWISYSQAKLDQSSQQTDRFDPNEYIQWGIDTEDTSVAIGAGLKGHPSDELEVGANVELARDRSKYPLYTIEVGTSGSPSPLANELPTITYRRAMLKLYAEYDLDEHTGVRLDYRYDRVKNDDWMWSQFNYTGTTVTQLPRESNHFIGLTYYYRGW
ncbi:MtrB/PioB family decaheme-associated outer membrane protein [Motiliproteus sediminis]|uniref:MtrB/PioB family decaheme-associated outer membrane protein n=1 Tax=Motiliproteus sediminis TaxID=1468178 RepID=UPI001AEF98E7|nr:MtrB/PioB family decaheme-associated outer membrane protein [Motiliproteus sediminis]